MGELAARIRAKYPGSYDDLPDTDLESKVVAKYPGVYDHLVTPPAEEYKPIPSDAKRAIRTSVLSSPMTDTGLGEKFAAVPNKEWPEAQPTYVNQGMPSDYRKGIDPTGVHKGVARTVVAGAEGIVRAGAGAVKALQPDPKQNITGRALDYTAQALQHMRTGVDLLNPQQEPESPLMLTEEERKASPIGSRVQGAIEGFAPFAGQMLITGGGAIPLGAAAAASHFSESSDKYKGEHPEASPQEIYQKAAPGALASGAMVSAMGPVAGGGRQLLQKAVPKLFPAKMNKILTYGRKEILRDIGATTLTDAPYFVAQGIASGEIDKRMGISPEYKIEDSLKWDSLLESTLTAALFGTVHAAKGAKTVAQVKDAINNPERPVVERLSAARYVENELRKRGDKQGAEEFAKIAKAQIVYGQPVSYLGKDFDLLKKGEQTDAEQERVASETDGSSSPQPEVGKEGGDPAEGGEGVQPPGYGLETVKPSDERPAPAEEIGPSGILPKEPEGPKGPATPPPIEPVVEPSVAAQLPVPVEVAPAVEPVQPEAPVNNASGQTDVSVEAVSELKSRKRQKIDTVIIDSRSGKERPAIGIRPEDNSINPYDVMVRRYPDGREEVLQKGLKAKALQRKEKTSGKEKGSKAEVLKSEGAAPVAPEVKPKKSLKPKEPVAEKKPKDLDEFTKMLDEEAERKRDGVRAKIDPEKGGKIDLEPIGNQKERYAVISKNIDETAEEYPWRVTMFDDKGPSGHSVHKTLDGEPGYGYSTSAVEEVAHQLPGKEIPWPDESAKVNRLKKAKEPEEPIATEDIDFLRSAHQNVRDTDFGKVVIDGNVKEATWSTYGILAPYLRDAGVKDKKKALEVIQKAMDTGKLPPKKNVAERRLVEMAIAHEKAFEEEARNRVELADEVERYSEENYDPAALEEALNFFDEIVGKNEPEPKQPKAEPIDINAKFAAEADPETVKAAKGIIKSLLKMGVNREEAYTRYNGLRGKGEYIKESSFMKLFDESDAKRKGAKVRNLEMGVEAEARKEEKAQGGFGFDDSAEPPTGKGLKGKRAKRQYDDAQDSGPTKPTPAAPKAWELPELLELAKAINNGSVPRLVRNIAKNVLGRFQHAGPKIILRKDLFAGPLLAEETRVKTSRLDAALAHFEQGVRYRNPGVDIIFRKTYDRMRKDWRLAAYRRDPNYVLKIFGHEIGHNIDFVPDFLTKGRGNILGHIAALKNYGKEFLEKYPGAKGKPLTDADRSRLMKEARRTTPKGEDIVTVITREVPRYEEVGITAEMVTEIWNGMNGRGKFPELYKYIAEMSDGEKKQVVVQAMRGIVDERLKRFASRKQVGVDVVTETIVTPAKERPEALKKRFEELIAEEIRKRRLYSKEVVMKELQDLSMKWKPFDPADSERYTAYRFSPSELYADAISVLFNNPALLKSDAPTFSKAFFNYMGERAEFRDAYRGITRRYRDPEGIMAERYQQSRARSEAGQEKAGEIRVEKAKKDRLTAGKILDEVVEGLAEKNWKVLKDLPATPEGRAVRNQLNEIQYLGGEVGNYVKKVSNIRKEFEAAGMDIHDFHEYLLAKHIIKNRNDMATEGRTAKTEQDKLDWMKKNDPKKFAAMEKAAQDFYESRKYIWKRIEESGIVTDSLMDIIKSRPEYVHIEKQKDTDELNIETALDRNHGKGTSTGAGWKKHAEGMMDDLENTFVATVLQDMSILRMAKINETKRAMTDVFEGINLATVAEMKFNKNEGGMRPVDPGEGKGLLTVLKDGKPKYYVVDKHVSDTFLYDPIKSNAIVRVNAYIMQYFRDILVSKNPAWMARNIFRDFKGTVKNNPEIAWWNPADRLKLMKNYREAFKEVRADEVGTPIGKFKLGKKRERVHSRSEDLEFMYQNRMLTEDRMYGTRDKTFDDELQQIEHAFRFVDEKSAIAAWQKAKDFYNYLDEWGQVSEKTSKLAGMKFLRAKGLKGRELAARVRERVGTPDYRRRGTWHAVMNNAFMFSNVNTQGIRAAVAAYRQDPMSYIFKTIETNVLPKILLGAAAAGLMGDDIKKVVNKIPSWERRNYSVYPLPSAMIQPLKDAGIIGQTSQARITMPMDYEGQFFGALGYDLAKGIFEAVQGEESAESFTDARKDLQNIVPWGPKSLSPHLMGIYNWIAYFSGKNPNDPFREKSVLTAEQEKYQQVEGPMNSKSLKGMGVYSWNASGLSSLYRMDNKEFPKELTITERALKTTPLNMIGSFIRVDDAGHQQNLQKGIFDKRNRKAIASYEIGDLVYEAVKEGKTKTVEDRNILREKIRKAAKENNVAPGPYLDRLRWNIKSVEAKKEYGLRPSSRKELKVLKEQD